MNRRELTEVDRPRGWSCIHLIEGYENTCRNASVLDNQVGPAGHSPSNGYQFRRRQRRDDVGPVYAAGQWADGISNACASSTITGNVIQDTTDGGVVIFGAPDSIVRGNTIIANERQALGMINMVDWAPWRGNFTGVQVVDNTLISSSTFTKVGIAIGALVTGMTDDPLYRTYGGLVTDNIFSAGQLGYFGVGIAVAGHNHSTVLRNSMSSANFGGESTFVCFPDVPAPSVSPSLFSYSVLRSPMICASQLISDPDQPLLYEPKTTPFRALQAGFVLSTSLRFMICTEPGPISYHGEQLLPPPPPPTNLSESLAGSYSRWANITGSSFEAGNPPGMVIDENLKSFWLSSEKSRGSLYLKWNETIGISSVKLFDRPELTQ